ncbi:MAG: SGNH/GDSL hydrolase family protein [Rhodospirillales bacterium]|nr:SGNH/GDSL hydrolase family protein [Rhodospirillales bacterium]
MFSRLKNLYRSLGSLTFNVIVLFILVNLLSVGALAVRDYLKANPGTLGPDNPWNIRAKAYPGWKSSDIYDLFIETWERQKYEYEPMAQFREAPFKGRYVNVSEHGFRQGKEPGVWPPSPDTFNIFVFGGSTTFGYGLPDWQTIPAVLEKKLRAKGVKNISVYNFGRGYFFSTHEMLLFQRLLMEGHVPSMAVFIDGMNDFYHLDREFIWSDKLKESIAGTQITGMKVFRNGLDLLPTIRLMKFLYRYLGSDGKKDKKIIAEQSIKKIVKTGSDPEAATKVLTRFIQNQKMIRTLAGSYGVEAVFVWQPTPLYKYDLSKHPFAGSIHKSHKKSATGYKTARQWFDKGRLSPDMAWCADIHERSDRTDYVDSMHYTAAFTETVVECIIEETNLTTRISRRTGSK